MRLEKFKDLESELGEEQETWAISYGDMITLLLSFFVIFFSTDFKKPMTDKLEQQVHLSLDEFKKMSVSEHSQVDLKLAKEIEAQVYQVGHNFIISFRDMKFFDQSQTEPTAKAKKLLEEFSKKYIPFAGKYKVSIKAFTDKVPVRKWKHRYSDNLELSALRSVATMRVLQKSGIPLSRMEIGGHGEMDRLKALKSQNDLSLMSPEEILNISRTVVLIIKPDDEQSVL